MVITAAFIMALGLLPAFQPEATVSPRPLMWETPVSWSASAAPLPPSRRLHPNLEKKIAEAQKICQELGPKPAAEHLAKADELELILFRAGLRRQAGDYQRAQADYEKILQSKNRTVPRALALGGYKEVLRQRIANGEKALYSRLIQCLKEEWRNEEALNLLPAIVADPEVPDQVKKFMREQEPIMALRLGRFERAAELWAEPATSSENQWLARTEQRRGDFIKAAESRLKLALKNGGKERGRELTSAWDILARGGLYVEALALADKYPELKKTADYNWRMGLAALSAGKTEPAEAFFKELIKNPKHPRRPAACYFMGRVLDLADRHEDALKIYAELAEGPFNYYQILARGRLAPPEKRPGGLSAPMLALLETGPSGLDRDSLGYQIWITEKGLTKEGAEEAASELARLGTVLAAAHKTLNAELVQYLENHQWPEIFDLLLRDATAMRTSAPAAGPLWPTLAATIAAGGGDYRLAVSLLSRLPSPEPKKYPGWSHPLIYGPEIKAAYREHGLSPSLLLALIRTESAYQADIMSASNARGLMQLLPATANKIAARLGEDEPGATDLFNPQLNIRYGAWYLAALIDGFEDEALALAGYNGGPYNIKSLIEAKQGMPLDVFIESLTFEETIKYIKRIIESKFIYESAYLGQAVLPDLTRAVTPPKPTLPDF